MGNVHISGLHHVTAIAGDPQKNVDFYAGVLGLRLVKRTINFDAPDVYHLYYGDETGSPGSIMTFFPYGSDIRQGRHGLGQTATTTFSIPQNSIDYWIKRLDHFQVSHKEPQERMEEVVIYLEDPDGLGIELVANSFDTRPPFSYGHIPLEFAIRGFFNVELWEPSYELTEALLVNQLGYTFLSESGSRRRYASEDPVAGQFVDIVWDAQKQRGAGGKGTVHHIAFNTQSDETQLELREKLLSAGYSPTQVLDRQYFHSIYFREPGGVLFEVATTGPGFLYDEDRKKLGEGLKLPPWEENRRKFIEDLLAPITLHPENYASPY
ncbi:MAG: VOC family protein [Bacteroidota bacterium]